jgi:hypothetical protein
MTVQTPCQGVSPNETLAGPARQGEAQSPFWRHVQELMTLQRLHANSDDVLEIAIRRDLTDDERLQELERLAQKKQGVIDMLPTITTTNPSVNGVSAAEIARCESSSLATDIQRIIMSKPSHIQMLAVNKVLAELIAESVSTRQLGPVEGLLEEIESNIDFGDAMQVRQYARGLAVLIEDLRCRSANF